MAARMRLMQSALSFSLIAVCLNGFGADASSGSGSSCTQLATDNQTSTVNIPDYKTDSDDTPDPDAEAAEKLWRAYQKSVFDDLSASPDPHNWALATLVRAGPTADSETPVRASLIKRAIAALPDDPMVQWVALEQGQGKFAQATTDAALQTLQDLEADNAAVWIEVLARAVKNKDTAAEDAALARMAISTRFDTHWADSLKRLLDTYRHHPVADEYIHLASKQSPELSSRTVANYAAAATGYAMALPAFQHIVNACRLNLITGENASRAGNCAAIGRLMAAQGDTLIANRIGLAVLRV